MKKIKLLSALLAVCMIATMFTGCRFIKEGALASINGEDISKEVFSLYFIQVQNEILASSGVMTLDAAEKFWQEKNEDGVTVADAARERAMGELALIYIKCQKAEGFNISLSEEEKTGISEQIGEQITQMGGNSVFESELKSIGSSREAYTLLMEKMLLASKVDEHLMSLPEYTITDDEAIKSVKETYIKAKHILFNTMDAQTGISYTTEEIAEVKKLAENILSQIKNGADFDELMKTHTQDPGIETNPDGYVFGKGQMVPQFEEAAYALKAGEVSGLVESTYGFHIIKREELNLTDSQAKEHIETEKSILQYNKIKALFETWENEAKTKVNKRKLSKVDVM